MLTGKKDDISELQKCYLRYASDIADLSKAERLRVGSVFVKSGNIIAFGYNGTPSGFPNSCELEKKTKPEVIHAEENCLLKCLETSSPFGADVYSTHSPCPHCAALMVQVGINKVYYLFHYFTTEGLVILTNGEVQHQKVDI